MRFGRYHKCALQKAWQEKRPATKDDYKKSCHRAACSACGKSVATAFMRRHLWKGRMIVSRAMWILLPWEVVKVASKGQRELSCFLRQVDLLVRRLESGAFGEIAGFVLGVEYGRLSVGRLRLHVHLAVLPGKLKRSRLRRIIVGSWKEGGGISVVPRVGVKIVVA